MIFSILFSVCLWSSCCLSSPVNVQVAILKMEALSKPLKAESASILCVAVWRNQRGASAKGLQFMELFIW